MGTCIIADSLLSEFIIMCITWNVLCDYMLRPVRAVSYREDLLVATITFPIQLQVDRKLYKRFLKYLHDHEDEKQKITSMSRRRSTKVYHTL